MGDNASSNDGELIRSINLEPHHRLRCAGHIINLIVKATIYGNNVTRFEEELAQADPMDQFTTYRRLGVIGKLHKLLNGICASHKRRELFNEVQQQVNDELLYYFNSLQLVKYGGIR